MRAHWLRGLTCPAARAPPGASAAPLAAAARPCASGPHLCDKRLVARLRRSKRPHAAYARSVVVQRERRQHRVRAAEAVPRYPHARLGRVVHRAVEGLHDLEPHAGVDRRERGQEAAVHLHQRLGVAAARGHLVRRDLDVGGPACERRGFFGVFVSTRPTCPNTAPRRAAAITALRRAASAPNTCWAAPKPAAAAAADAAATVPPAPRTLGRRRPAERHKHVARRRHDERVRLEVLRVVVHKAHAARAERGPALADGGLVAARVVLLVALARQHVGGVRVAREQGHHEGVRQRVGAGLVEEAVCEQVAAAGARGAGCARRAGRSESGGARRRGIAQYLLLRLTFVCSDRHCAAFPAHPRTPAPALAAASCSRLN
jgi:hypothetical protein